MITRKLFARTLALAGLVALPASAGPFEDGSAAYSKQDYVTAWQDFTIAAAQGNTVARGRLGYMFLYGIGVQKDPAQALFWLGEAAAANDAFAQTALGQLYQSGTLEKQSWSEAANLYRKAADQGFSAAQTLLGEIYLYGHPPELPQDLKQAAGYFQLAAAQNEPQGAFDLGFMYYRGAGLTQDYARAASLFEISAKGGFALAQSFLGVAYASGQGVPQDYAASANYLKLAAHQGDIDAVGLLGEECADGHGVAQDYVRAYLLTNIASAQLNSAGRDTALKERDSIGTHLSAIQIQAAQNLASYCHDSGYDVCVNDAFSVISEEADPRIAANQTQAPAPGAPASPAPAAPVAAASAAPDGMKEVATGSGFYVSADGDIVTAAHVVAGCTEMRSPYLKLKVVAADPVSDVAILASSAKSPNFVKLRGGRGPRVGEDVVVLGFPLHGLLGEDVIVTTGVVSSLAGIQNDRRDIQISAPTQPGNSGGPIVGEDGALVGVLQGGLDAVKFAQAEGELPQNVNFAVSVGTLQSFLNAHQVNYVLADGSGPRKSSTAISSDATRYTMLLECWK